MREVRIAAISTESFDGDYDYRNAEQAVGYVAEAARNRAQMVCFPEGYPGPAFGPMDSGGHLTKTPVEMMCECARQYGVYISCGNLEESRKVPGAYYLAHKLISPAGKVLANYRRCQPTPPLLNASLYGEKMHLLPGNDLIVVETEFGNIGLLICTELFVPELARTEMLMGAEIILAPNGGLHHRAGATRSLPGGQLSTWHCIARATAAMNLVYVVTTVNTFSPDQRRGSFIAGPEENLGMSDRPGIVYADLDMERLWYLRTKYEEEEDVGTAVPPNYRGLSAKLGIIHQRRPDLYRKLVEPQADVFDYYYYKRGLKTWKDEQYKVHSFVRQRGTNRVLRVSGAYPVADEVAEGSPL